MHPFHSTVFLIGYGDQNGIGRGIYRLHTSTDHSFATLEYPCQMKPGALIQIEQTLYMSFVAEDQQRGVLIFHIDASQQLTLLRRQKIPYLISSWHRIPQTQFLLGSSFYDGVDVLLDLDQNLDILSVHSHQFRERGTDPRQTTTHPHHVQSRNHGKSIYSVDMGIDLTYCYEIEHRQLKLQIYRIESPLSSGPRILRFSPNENFAYLLHEIENTVAVYSIIADVFHEIQRISTLAAPTSISSAAGCVITENGQYLLVTNRGEDSLSLFSINSDDGTLTLADRIKTRAIPRDIFLHQNQIVIASQAENFLQIFSIDDATSTLKFHHEVGHVAAPVGFAQTSLPR